MPKVPSFGREAFRHEIKTLVPDTAFDDVYHLNTQSGTQWDGFRHVSRRRVLGVHHSDWPKFAHVPTKLFYNKVQETARIVLIGI